MKLFRCMRWFSSIEQPPVTEFKRMKAREEAIKTTKWHLRQIPKTESSELSKNKVFKHIPVDPKILRYINSQGLGRRKRVRLSKAEYLEKQKKIVPRKKLRRSSDPVVSLFNGAFSFVWGAQEKNRYPGNFILPEIAIVGRSNVGKSSLINALTNTSLVKVSEKAGKTRQLGWYNLSNRLHIVDVPGLGFAFASEELREQWKDMIFHLTETRIFLKRVMILIDSRHPLKTNDLELMDHLDKVRNAKYQIVLTKADLVLPDQLARRCYVVVQELKDREMALKQVMMVSSANGAGLDHLKKEIEKLSSKKVEV